MSIKPTKSKTATRARKARKPRQRRSGVGSANTAKVVEVLATVAINTNTPYIFSKGGITGVRAPIEAQLFGLYRIARMVFTYKPLFDTYSSSLPGVGNSPNSVPQLYWQMNRYGDAPAAFDGNYMRTLGSKPNRLDDNNVTFSYKPNMLMVAQDNAGNNASQVKITPWLSTDERPQDQVFNISTAEHFGHLLYVESGAAGTGDGPVALMDVKVIYEFKSPRVPTTAASQLHTQELLLKSPAQRISL